MKNFYGFRAVVSSNPKPVYTAQKKEDVYTTLDDTKPEVNFARTIQSQHLVKFPRTLSAYHSSL